MESTLHPTQNILETGSQSCLKVVSKLRQLWSQHCIQHKISWKPSLTVVSKLSLSCLEVVSMLSQCCLKVEAIMELRQLWSQHCIQQKYLGNWVSKLSQS